MYKKHTLDNGLRLIVSPMPEMSSVSLGIWIGVGGRYESAHESGISHLIEHMLFKGTETRSAKDLKQAIEGVGGMLNGFTADEVTCYMVKVPADHLKLGLDILSDMVFNPKFKEDDLVKEKDVICEEIKMYKDQPADHVSEVLAQIMWPSNPLGRPLTGTISNVQGFKMGEMVSFKNNNYQPSNMAIIAAGRVLPDEIHKYASDRFGGEKAKRPSFEKPVISQEKARLKVVNKDINQTHIALGFHALNRDMSEMFIFTLLSVILGGNMSSRLFEELREKYGLCYDISSYYKKHSDTGEFLIHAGVDKKKTLKSVLAIVDELRMIKDLGITDDELKRAKEYTKGQLLLSMESTSLRMIWFGYKLMVDKNIMEIAEILKLIEGVTREDVKKASEKIFKPSSANLAMIGRVASGIKDEIQEALRKL